jgi:hypothetical protein
MEVDSLRWARKACLLQNPKTDYSIRNSPPLHHTVNGMNPVHVLIPHRFKPHFNTILVCTVSKVISLRFLNKNFVCISHLMWVSYHNGMARSQVVDGQEGTQIWSSGANILNKQSWKVDKGRSSSLGVGWGTNK